ncbi:hypothetical protein Pst134EB_002196 [Puccinia striiformis f. sp. tritici]|nr:hypothetical protein Pst134EB_002196 [Puccinia striiformis f. sp. tritici]
MLCCRRSLADSDGENPSERQPVLNRIPNKNRNALEGHRQLMSDYLVEDAVYSNKDFERRFRVTKGVFFRLCNDLQTKNSTGYFIQKPVSSYPHSLIDFGADYGHPISGLHWQDRPQRTTEDNIGSSSAWLWCFI